MVLKYSPTPTSPLETINLIILYNIFLRGKQCSKPHFYNLHAADMKFKCQVVETLPNPSHRFFDKNPEIEVDSETPPSPK